MNSKSCHRFMTRMFVSDFVGFSQLLTLVLFLGFLRQGLGHILCSVCDSSSGDVHCQKSPPPPINCTICKEEDDLGNCVGFPDPPYEYCMVVRKYDTSAKNRTLLDTIRSCSAFHMRGKTCSFGHDSERGRSIYMCHTTCEEDGCNSAEKIVPALWRHLVVVVVSSMITLQLFTGKALV